MHEMVGWHHRRDEHEFELEMGQPGMLQSRGHKESETT